jgi:FAD/FMN-containing dehydrogenase
VGYTLGGGAGLLARTFGFAADSVLRADVVTAEAESLSVSAAQHPDLFWALRGGGGNFAIVTALEFRLNPVSRVYTGTSFHPIERAARTLVRYREWALREPEESNTSVTLMRLPDGPQVPEPLRGRPVVAVRATYHGTSDAAESALSPLLSAAGAPLMGGFRSTSYAEVSTGPAPTPTASRQHMDMFADLRDEVINTLVASVTDYADPVVRAVDVRHWGGAMARPGPDAGPVGHRDVPFSAVAMAPLAEPGRSEVASAAIDDLAARLCPYATGGTFLNFLADPSRTRTAFTQDNWRRLAEVKRAWDPDNFLRLNHNIAAALENTNGDFR